MKQTDNQTQPAATVLVVDDDPGARLLVGSALEVAGFRVITAEDGKSAMAAVSRPSRRTAWCSMWSCPA